MVKLATSVKLARPLVRRFRFRKMVRNRRFLPYLYAIWGAQVYDAFGNMYKQSSCTPAFSTMGEIRQLISRDR